MDANVKVANNVMRGKDQTHGDKGAKGREMNI